MNKLSFIVALFLAATPVRAEPRSAEDFVAANLIATLYHELGHALIDQLQLPVFGQEEDAADVLSVLLIDGLFEEETTVNIALDTAFGFSENAEEFDAVFWDVHGPDLQRYYTTLCLFYGANPEERDDIALDMGLPADRAVTCEDEFQLASDSWGPVLDELAEAAPGRTELVQRDRSDAADFTFDVLSEEIASLNTDFKLPDPITIVVDTCGEANAFYDLETAEITMCSEFADYLLDLVSD